MVPLVLAPSTILSNAPSDMPGRVAFSVNADLLITKPSPDVSSVTTACVFSVPSS